MSVNGTWRPICHRGSAGPPLAESDDKTLVVSLGSRRGALHERHGITELLEESTPHVLELTPDHGWCVDGGGRELQVPQVGGSISEHNLGLRYLPLLQLLANHRGAHKGLDPDNSRNLSHHVQLSRAAGNEET